MFSLFSIFRKSSVAAYALGRFWLTIFLLSTTLCFLVNSYAIDDDSCRDYDGKGVDIRGEIQQAINEVQDMARNAFDKILSNNPSSSTMNLMQSLFGMDPSRYSIVGNHFAAFAQFYENDDFVVVCGDLMVNLIPNTLAENSNPHAAWADNDHGWTMHYEDYSPCNSTRKPGQDYTIEAFTILQRLIYVCPLVLDRPKGRTLAPYKDRILAGAYIDDYMLVPAILLHELYLTHIASPELNEQSVQAYPPLNFIYQTFATSPAYLQNLPETTAFGFHLCSKLAIDDPDRAIKNPDSLALAALGLYLHKNDWSNYGYAQAISS